MTRLGLLLAVAIAYCSSVGAEHVSAQTAFADEVRPLLETYCYSCHGPTLQSGNIRLDQLSENLVEDRRDAEIWRNSLNKLRRGEMPPAGLPQPSSEERDHAISVLQAVVDRAMEERRSTDGRTVLRRLNRTEYQNTMTDLLGYEMDYARDVPPDGMSRDGFRNNASSLRMTAVQLEYYLEAARKGLERVIVSGPPPIVSFRFNFTESNLDEWLLRAEQPKKNVIGRTDAFLGHMDPAYPEEGEFVVKLTVAAELKPGKGPPIMNVSVGYRPDTEILFRTMDAVELTSEEPQTFEFRGFMENFPQPFRGQSKYPGLVVRVTNTYDDGTPRPELQTREKEDGKKERYYADEPDYPKVRVEKVTLDGPIYDAWPPARHRRILFESELRESDPTAYVGEVLEKFLTRAWRRPPEPSQVAEYVEFFDSQAETFPIFEERMRETLAMVLISPEFLYLLEPESEERRPLDAWELSSRLSYFLWSTMPDDELLMLSQTGELLNPDVLGSQVARMLQDERVSRFIDDFFGSWIYLEAMDKVAIDPIYYPGFNDNLKTQIREETRYFLQELLRDDLSATNIIDSNFLTLNETMARHYDIDGVSGSAFRRVAVDEASQRGGLLTQASMLMGNSTGEDSHPIKRAVWVRKRLLDDPPSPPPANVPELDSESPELAHLSVREQLRKHRQQESCASCHVDIDPWGVAFEHFDAIGQWRNDIRRLRERPPVKPVGPEEDEDQEEVPLEFDLLPVDAHETLPDGTEIRGVDDLRAYLLGPRRDDFARTIVSKLLAYSLGRSLEFTDQSEVDRLTTGFLANDMKLRSLVQEVVKNDLFRTK
jgi:mono/diheme cytochrome c family protein